jgi:hypothetical protein
MARLKFGVSTVRLRNGTRSFCPTPTLCPRSEDLLERPLINLAVDLLQKVAFRHPTRGLQVPKAYLPRLFPHYLRPPVIDFNRRLPRYYNMLNYYYVAVKLFFRDFHRGLNLV